MSLLFWLLLLKKMGIMAKSGCKPDKKDEK